MLSHSEEESQLISSKSGQWSTVFQQNFNRITHFLKPYAKFLVLVGCYCLVFAYNLSFFIFDPATISFAQYRKPLTMFTIDQEWPLGLTAEFLTGGRAGRDFFFTHGLLGQFFVAIPSLLIGKNSAFSGFPIINLVYTSLMVFIFIGVLLSIKRLDWRYSGFIFVFLILTSFMLSWIPLRPLLGIISGLLLVKTLCARTWLGRSWLAGLTGLSCFAVMSFTFESGLYSVFVALGICIFFAGLALINLKNPLRSDLLSPLTYLAVAGLIFGAFFLCNLLLSIYFKLSSPDYQNLFDYQIYSLELVRGYNFVMGSAPPNLTLFRVFTFAAMLGYVIWFILANFKKFVIKELYFFCVLFLVATVWLKSIIIRGGDSLIQAWLLFFVFLLAGYKGWESSTRQLPRLWLIILLISFCGWHKLTLEPIKATADVFEGNNNVFGKVSSILEYAPNLATLIPKDIASQLDPDPKVQLFTYPYQYTMSNIAGKQNPHSMLQSYLALSTVLQDKVVADLHKTLPAVEVVWGINFLKTTALDGVPDITRNPIIFEYIYSHFQIKKDILADGGYLLLKPRQQVKPLTGQELSYKLDNSNPANISISLNQPAACNMLRIQSKINYPLTSWLGRPTGFSYSFYNNYGLMFTSRMLSLEAGKSFMTFLPMFEHKRYQDIFANRSFEPYSWHTLKIEADDKGLFAVNPTSFNIEKIECIVF